MFDLLFVIYFTALQSSLGMMTDKVMARSYIGELKDCQLVNKTICGMKESPTQAYEVEEWKETVLPTLEGNSLFYKSLPHRTYCCTDDKPSGSAKCKDRLTLPIITNNNGSDHRKLSVIGKAKTPHCLQKCKMQVKDMAVNWYASKNAWMIGDIHHRIMTKFNTQMRAAGCHVLYMLQCIKPPSSRVFLC